MYKLVFFVLGGLIGGFVGYIIASGNYSKKLDELEEFYNEEIDKLTVEDDDIVKSDNSGNNSSCGGNAVGDTHINKDLHLNKEYRDYTASYNGSGDGNNEKVTEEDRYEKYVESSTHPSDGVDEPVYLIAEAVYNDDVTYTTARGMEIRPDKDKMTYYIDDHTLYNSDDEMIDDIKDFVGPEGTTAIDSGIFETVYVRNEKYWADYEIEICHGPCPDNDGWIED